MTNHAHITVVLDRTGSMQDIRDDVIGGFNGFLAAQQAEPIPATLTLVQFDSQDPYEVLHAARPIGQVPPLTAETYVPRASTPLYDAIGRGILDLEATLARLPEAERPAKVVFVIVTDGHENASVEFDRARVLALIEAKRGLGWEFVFLSADPESFDDAQRVGVKSESRLHFKKSAQGNACAWASVSAQVVEYRSGRAQSVEFGDADRDAQEQAE